MRRGKFVRLFATIALALLASVGTLLGLPLGSAKGVANLPQGFTDSQVVSGVTTPGGTVADRGSYSCRGGSEPPPIADTTPPRVSSTGPGANATRVAPGADITATFSEAMRTNSIDGTTVKLFRAGTINLIGAAVSYDGAAKKGILNPNANLQLGTKYRAVVTTGVTDLAGNRLDQDSSLSGLQQKAWTFTIRN